jgi:hypothetical protein
LVPLFKLSDWLFVGRLKRENNEKGPWGGVSIQKRVWNLKEQGGDLNCSIKTIVFTTKAPKFQERLNQRLGFKH